MDNLIERASKLDKKTDGKTVLIASTWDKRGCLRTYGADFIIKIANAGYNVIVRPHPYSYVYEADFISALQKDLQEYQNIKFDDEVDNLKSLARADILVADVSGVRFDYVLAFNRPVISLELGDEDNEDYEYKDLDSYWNVEIGKKLGAYIKRNEIEKIVEKINENISRNSLLDIDPIVTNIGSSAKVIAQQIAEIIEKD
jgi:CDP-glycerol glycerophosphotransferase (TagB/SpsB family)